MARFHLVRTGALGHVGRFAAVDGLRYARGARVVLRTARGLELGDVLAPPEEDAPAELRDGDLLRAVTVQDDLLVARLVRNRDAAYAACQRRLVELGEPAVLVDVEHTFDGQSLYFYFLGAPSPRAQQLSAELAELYDAEVRFSEFAATLASGCGPDCGQESAANGGCSNCATGCAVADACAPRKRA